MIFMDYI